MKLLQQSELGELFRATVEEAINDIHYLSRKNLSPLVEEFSYDYYGFSTSVADSLISRLRCFELIYKMLKTPIDSSRRFDRQDTRRRESLVPEIEQGKSGLESLIDTTISSTYQEWLVCCFHLCYCDSDTLLLRRDYFRELFSKLKERVITN